MSLVYCPYLFKYTKISETRNQHTQKNHHVLHSSRECVWAQTTSFGPMMRVFPLIGYTLCVVDQPHTDWCGSAYKSKRVADESRGLNPLLYTFLDLC